MTTPDLIDPDELTEAAVTATGLDDLGDPAHREGLERLCTSLREEAELNDLGVAAMAAQITAQLENRLRVVDWVQRHPDLGCRRANGFLDFLGAERRDDLCAGIHQLAEGRMQ